MVTIVALDEHRARRAQAKVDRRPAAQRLLDAQNNLTVAVRTLRELTGEIDAVARRLHSNGDAPRATDGEAIGTKLQKLRQCQTDYEEIARLLEAADIEGCIKLRDLLLSRAHG